MTEAGDPPTTKAKSLLRHQMGITSYRHSLIVYHISQELATTAYQKYLDSFPKMCRIYFCKIPSQMVGSDKVISSTRELMSATKQLSRI